MTKFFFINPIVMASICLFLPLLSFGLSDLDIVFFQSCRVPVGTPYSLSYCYHGTAPVACTVLCKSRPCRDALLVVILLLRHCAGGLHCLMQVASLSGRLIVSHAALTALRPVVLVPCYAYRVPAGTPYSLSYYYHGTAPLWGLYRVKHVASLSGRPIVCHIAITALRPVELVPC